MEQRKEAQDLDRRGREMAGGEHQGRRRILRLRAQRGDDVAAIEGERVHGQPPCISSRRIMRSMARRPRPTSTTVQPACRASPCSAAPPLEVGEVDAERDVDEAGERLHVQERPQRVGEEVERQQAAGEDDHQRRQDGVHAALVEARGDDDVRQHQDGGAERRHEREGGNEQQRRRHAGGRPPRPGAEAHQRQHDAGRQQHQHRARQGAGQHPSQGARIPVAVGVERPQPVVADAAGAHRLADLRIGDPRQQRQQRLAEPDIGDGVGQADRRRRGVDAVEGGEDHDADGAPPALRGKARQGCGAVLQHELEARAEGREVGTNRLHGHASPASCRS